MENIFLLLGILQVLVPIYIKVCRMYVNIQNIFQTTKPILKRFKTLSQLNLYISITFQLK